MQKLLPKDIEDYMYKSVIFVNLCCSLLSLFTLTVRLSVRSPGRMLTYAVTEDRMPCTVKSAWRDQVIQTM